MASISDKLKIKENDIIMTFNSNGELLGLGKSTSDSEVVVQKKFNTSPIDINDAAKKQAAKLFLSTEFKKEYSNEDGVIVKLKGGDKYLYVPGTIVDVPEGAAASTEYTVLVAAGRKIAKVPLANISTNFALKNGESGVFFSDTVISNILKPDTDYTSISEADLNGIIQGTGKITLTADLGSDPTYKHNEVKLVNSNTISTNTIKPKSVVPLGFNMVENAGSADEKIKLTEEANVVSNSVVFGGKKSKTRKNTMPLQFAPGAKRAYLKRRKSIRK